MVLEVILIIISVLLFIGLILTRLELKGKIENISNQLNTLQNQIGGTFDKSFSTITDIHKQLGIISTLADVPKQLSRIETMGVTTLEELKEISTIRDLLKPPQLRGKIGEVMLGHLLSQVFPSTEFYEAQYQLQPGKRVDFVVKIKDYLLPIDAKFSMTNLEKMIKSSTSEEQARYRKEFINDVKKHIDETKKYISPENRTTDFVLMYVPSETAYYEAFINDTDVLEYALKNKVFPTSPSTFYAFLMILLFGFKGLKIEEKAKIIINEISALKLKFDEFIKDFQTLGSHLMNAYNKYSDTRLKLTEFKTQVDKIEKI